MDDELRELETELRRLRPVPPSAELRARLRRDLATETPAAVVVPAATAAAPRWGRWWWLALPAAAAAALLFALRVGEPGAKAPARPAVAPPLTPSVAVAGTLKPIAADNLLCATEDEGVVTLSDGTAVRRERLHFVDTITWRNPRTNASLTWSVPREEVRLMPVNFQ